jgi:hypothetical protein
MPRASRAYPGDAIDPKADMSRLEIPQCSDLQAHRGVLSFGVEAQPAPAGFRTIQVSPKDLPGAPRLG